MLAPERCIGPSGSHVCIPPRYADPKHSERPKRSSNCAADEPSRREVRRALMVGLAPRRPAAEQDFATPNDQWLAVILSGRNRVASG